MSDLEGFAIDDRLPAQGSLTLFASRVTGRVVPWILRTRAARTLPMIPVSEFPKAGGTWFAQVLATYLGVPLPQRATMPYLMRCVVHGHHKPPMPDGFLVVRDPRACYVSLYFHRVWLVRANSNHRHFNRVREKWRSVLGIDPATVDPSAGLPRYVEALLSGNPLGEPSWDRYYAAWLTDAGRRSAVVVRYEDLRTDPLVQFGSAIERRFGGVDLARLTPSVNRYDFDVVRKGPSGPTDFARRGEVDGWRRDVPEHLHTMLDNFLSEVSQEYGYGLGTAR
jgi:hypothetical protein